MTKTILVTGSTDGIGLQAAGRLAEAGHRVVLHGRNEAKLAAARDAVGSAADGLVADLSRLDEVERLASRLPQPLDVLINNAGVFRVPQARLASGLDVRFVVNTIAPYVLARRLLPTIQPGARIVNLSSAAQAPVDLRAVRGDVALSDGEAYAQSKLALTMWSRYLADELGPDGPVVVAVNPGSMLGTNMVRDAYGVSGGDVGIGADILFRAALGDEFAQSTGLYFDNDSGQFAPPHPDALDPQKNAELVAAIESLL